MKNLKEIEKANAVADALARYSWLEHYSPSESGEIIARGRLAAKALLELQGIVAPTEKEIDLVLAGI